MRLWSIDFCKQLEVFALRGAPARNMWRRSVDIDQAQICDGRSDGHVQDSRRTALGGEEAFGVGYLPAAEYRLTTVLLAVWIVI